MSSLAAIAYFVTGAPARGTPGERLHRMGLAPQANVKGSPCDRRRQPRRFDLVLFNVFAMKWYMPANTYEEYPDATVRFFRGKIDRSIELLDGHFADNRHARLFEWARAREGSKRR